MPTLTTLHIWKNITRLGYFGLESFLSTQGLADECVLCIDPTSDDDTISLADHICVKYPKARVVKFEWPKQSSNGSAIGIASNFGLAQCHTDYVLNVQGDEVWPVALVEQVKRLWPILVSAMGVEAFEFKVLHLEHNSQQLQGGGTWQRQNGAAYTHAIKLWRNCPAYRFAPDAWSIQAQGTDGEWDEGNVKLKSRIVESEKWPILHLHDFFLDTVLERRRVQAEELWPTTPHYNATYEAMRDGAGQWKGLLDDPKWQNTTSPFMGLFPENIVRHLGQSQYRVHWEDLVE